VRLIGAFTLALAWGCSAEYVTLPDGADPPDGAGDNAQGAGDLHTADGGEPGTTGDGMIHTSDGLVCPPCTAPPSNDCVGSGPCGCAPYECPGDNDTVCGPHSTGWCPSGGSCECCPAGGPMNNCLCTTTCGDDDDCNDPLLPICNRSVNADGICTDAEFFCCWKCQ